MSAPKFGSSNNDTFGRWCQRTPSGNSAFGNSAFGGLLSPNSFGNSEIRISSNSLVEDKSLLTTSTIPQPTSSFVSNMSKQKKEKK